MCSRLNGIRDRSINGYCVALVLRLTAGGSVSDTTCSRPSGVRGRASYFIINYLRISLGYGLGGPTAGDEVCQFVLSQFVCSWSLAGMETSPTELPCPFGRHWHAGCEVLGWPVDQTDGSPKLPRPLGGQ